MTKLKPEIWVGCMASYNAGYLHGTWIDASEGVAKVWKTIRLMLESSPVAKETGAACEEWMISDYEGFGSYKVSEHEPIDTLCAIAEAIEKAEEIEEGLGEAVSELLSEEKCTLENLDDYIEDHYQGVHESKLHFIENFLDEIGYFCEIKDKRQRELIEYYFDYGAFVRDMELNCEIFFVETDWDKFHVFWGN
jgi:antirestriction protein